MKYELKRIGIWSTIKIGFLVWGLFGFLSGIYIALMMPILMKMVGSIGVFPGDMEAFTPFMFIFLPFMYSIMGAVIGTIGTIIVVGFYNLVSRLTGGIEINLEGDSIHPLDLPKEPPPPISEGENYPT